MMPEILEPSGEIHPQKLTAGSPGNDGETNRDLRDSKGFPFSGEPCLFWGVYFFDDSTADI